MMKNCTFQNNATRPCKKARPSSLSSLTGRGALSAIGGTINHRFRYITKKRLDAPGAPAGRANFTE
jgi:hypothetical protein